MLLIKASFLITKNKLIIINSEEKLNAQRKYQNLTLMPLIVQNKNQQEISKS